MDELIEKINNLLEDKIIEAENSEDPEISEQYTDGYISGLKMAQIIIDEEYGYVKGGGKYV